MRTSQLIFIGIKGSVIALNSETGQQTWGVHLSGANFVNVQARGDKVVAACNGEIYCLDSATGRVLWQNGLKGFGFGLATLAVQPNSETHTDTVLAEQIFQDQQADGPVAAASMQASAH